MENPIKMDDLGVPPFSETPTFCYIFSLLVHRGFLFMAAAAFVFGWFVQLHKTGRGAASPTLSPTKPGGENTRRRISDEKMPGYKIWLYT